MPSHQSRPSFYLAAYNPSKVSLSDDDSDRHSIPELEYESDTPSSCADEPTICIVWPVSPGLIEPSQGMQAFQAPPPSPIYATELSSTVLSTHQSRTQSHMIASGESSNVFSAFQRRFSYKCLASLAQLDDSQSQGVLHADVPQNDQLETFGRMPAAPAKCLDDLDPSDFYNVMCDLLVL